MKMSTMFLATCLLTHTLCAADPKEVSLRWTELEPAVAGRQIRMTLPNGPQIKGRVLAVEPQALRIQITKTSDKLVQPKGEISLPRTAIPVLQVMRYGIRWRIFGTAIGPVLVGAAGASVAARGAGTVNDLPKYIGYGAGAVIGTGVGGYFLGKRADRHVTPSGFFRRPRKCVMNSKHSTSRIRVIILAMVPAVVLGQSAEDSWSNLSRLRAGQKIQVVDMKPKAATGNFNAFSEDTISLLVGKDQISIPRANVLSVKNREGSHRRRNTLLGLAIGAAGGLAIGAIQGAAYHEEGETPVFLMVWTPIGAGAGAAVGAVLPAGQVTVYRAKARRTP